jgi:hypothetical protein
MADYDDTWAARDLEIVNNEPVLVRHVKGIVNELGPNPSGAQVDVTARLTALDSTVAGKANTSHTHSGADITSGVIAPARLGSGSADASKVLNGAGQWVANTVSPPIVLSASAPVPPGTPANTLIFRLPT